MKRTAYFTVAFIVGCVLLFFLLGRKHSGSAPPELQAPVPNGMVGPDASKDASGADILDTNAHVAMDPSQIPSSYEVSNRLYQHIQADWRKPISFYGRALDEDGNGIAGVSVRFQWADETESVNASTTESDPEGRFSLHGKFGRSLEVQVRKEGYYAARAGKRSFLYSLANEDELYSPDPGNPVIFPMHKKGQGAELITSQNGLRPNVWLRFPKDNSTVRLDFFEKQASPSGQLEMSQMKPPWQDATNWSFRLSIPNGGLLENTDEFPFKAPDTNYQSMLEYQFVRGTTNWTTQATKQFYIVFGEPRRYGWLRIESSLDQETVFLTYAINPDGSRNLEPAN